MKKPRIVGRSDTVVSMVRRFQKQLPAVIILLILACSGSSAENDFDARRQRLVEKLAGQGIRDEQVLAAIGRVPRHEFVPPELAGSAYLDRPLPIGQRQTISQPYVVALMTEALEIEPGDRVLEVGTGSGYQAAVLAEIGAEVYSIEIIESLGKRASELLESLGYEVHVKIGDGYFGWPEAAPFDAVIITAAAPRIPPRLVEQLKEGGRMVVPVGKPGQQLTVVVKEEGRVRTEELIPVLFVPMTGEIEG